MTYQSPPPLAWAGQRLKDRVVFVTGAASGNRAAAVRRFAAEGAKVVAASRRADRIEALAAELRAEGFPVSSVVCDVRDEASVQAAIAAVVAEHGRLDGAFNNAGVGGVRAPFTELSVDSLDAVLATNLKGVFLCMKHEIPAMLETGGGAIVNNASTAGLGGPPGMSGYAAAKHGVIGLTRTAAIDYAARNIRVNALAPGPILTERLLALGQETLDYIAGMVPMRRLGEPDEVARAAAWLCSDQASYLTGVTVPVDGGRMAM